MRTALVYDRVNKWGGAERVLLALHEVFPDAPLFTSVYHPQKAPWAQVFPKVVPSFLQKIEFFRDKHELLAPLMPLAFESLDLTGFDLVISITSEAAKGVITRAPTKHICYCLTPTRYLWSHHEDYFKDRVFKGVTKPLVYYLRKWDKAAAQRPDVVIAISKTVQERIKKYYGRESDVIYPPVAPLATTPIRSGVVKKDYFLVVSRLVPYKRVELAIEAFNQLGLPVVIVGKGSEETRLKRNAHANIKFVGEVSEDKLVDYYRGAYALVMPQEEDFGIVAPEAQAFGTPVIAYAKGGAVDTVIDGATGVLFKKQTVNELVVAIKRFEKMSFDKKFLQKNAKRFSKEKFKKNFLELISLVK